MDSKYLIFVIISVLLVAAIYSSSMFFVSAATTVCTGTSKTTTSCHVEDDKGVTAWDCKLNKDGKTWSCKQAKTMTGASISSELTDALSAATEETQIEPIVPKEPAFNDGLTTSPEEQDETEDPNEPAFNDGLTTSPGTR